MLRDCASGGVCLSDNRAICAVQKPKPIIPMKATKLLLIAALFTGFTSLSFAGPGVDYWVRISEAAKNRTTAEAKAKVDAPKPAAEIAAACSTCSCCAKKA
jgi:hypothetical protein